MGTQLIACFYCNVDSTPLVIFLVAMIGSLVLGTVCLGVGFFMSGKFRDTESTKYDVFKAEERQHAIQE